MAEIVFRDYYRTYSTKIILPARKYTSNPAFNSRKWRSCTVLASNWPRSLRHNDHWKSKRRVVNVCDKVLKKHDFSACWGAPRWPVGQPTSTSRVKFRARLRREKICILPWKSLENLVFFAAAFAGSSKIPNLRRRRPKICTLRHEIRKIVNYLQIHEFWSPLLFEPKSAKGGLKLIEFHW